MKHIELSNGGVAVVDDKDYERLSKHTWRRHQTKGYPCRVVKIDGKSKMIYMHQEVRPTKGIYECDHISGDVLDNRRSNLRPATHKQNMQNRKPSKNAQVPYKGVRIRKLKSGIVRYQAQMVLGKSFVHLGVYDTAEEAAKAYNEAAVLYHGRFARLNVVPEVELK